MSNLAQLCTMLAAGPCVEPSTIRIAWHHTHHRTLLTKPATPADVLDDARRRGGYEAVLASHPGADAHYRALTTRRLAAEVTRRPTEHVLVRVAVDRFDARPTAALASALTRADVALVGRRVLKTAVIKANSASFSTAPVMMDVRNLLETDVNELLETVTRADITALLLSAPHSEAAGLKAIVRTMERHGPGIADADFTKLARRVHSASVRYNEPQRAMDLMLVHRRRRHALIMRDIAAGKRFRVVEPVTPAPMEPADPKVTASRLTWLARSNDRTELARLAADIKPPHAPHAAVATAISLLLRNHALERSARQELLAVLAASDWVPGFKLDMCLLYPDDPSMVEAQLKLWPDTDMKRASWQPHGGVERAPVLLRQWFSDSSVRLQEMAQAACRDTAFSRDIFLELPTGMVCDVAAWNTTTCELVGRELNRRIMGDENKVAMLVELFDEWAGTFGELLDVIEAAHT